MKYRLPILVFVIVLTALAMFLAQSRMDVGSVRQVSMGVSCNKVKQCLGAESAWPKGMQDCPSTLAPLTVRSRSADGKWGYAINYGECSQGVFIQPQYDVAEQFGNNGLAKVSRNDRWGYINLKGEEIVPLHFDEVGEFDHGQVPVRLNKKWGYFDSDPQRNVKGAPVFDAVAGTWGSDLSAVLVDGKWGYINAEGRIIIRPRFDRAVKFDREGLAKVELNRKWGVIDTQGNFVIQPGFDVIFSTVNPRLLLVGQNQRYGYFDKQGKEIIPPRLLRPVEARYDRDAIQVHLNDSVFTSVSAGTATGSPVPLGAWFYLDSPNEKLRFDENGKAQLWRNGEWFYISSTGQLLVDNRGS